MTPMKLDILFAFLCYGGNGGTKMQCPEISFWYARLNRGFLAEEKREGGRIGRVVEMEFGDTPLTMERNRIVKVAKDQCFDIVVMVDSDNVPDAHLSSDPNAKPWFSTSFDFLYQRKLKGLPTVVCAPYCGLPPSTVPGQSMEENVYVFHATNPETDSDQGVRFDAYSRAHAAQMQGIQECVAAPTGLIMYDLDAFDLMPVRQHTNSEILDLYQAGQLSKERALNLLAMESYFFYQYKDGLQTAKASTEDVTNTREIQMAGYEKHGESVLFCNWDAWAGHWKPKLVGKPRIIGIDEVSGVFREAVEQGFKHDEKIQELKYQSADGRPVLDAEDIEFAEPGEFVDEPIEKDIAEDEFEPPVQSNGVPIVPRIVNGYKVYSVGHVTPTSHLEALSRLVERMHSAFPDRMMRVVEVGSWAGESAVAIASKFGEAGGIVFCVDTWQGNTGDWTGELVEKLGGPERLIDWFAKNCGPMLNTQIRPVRGESVKVAESFEEEQELDLVFIDASHDEEEVRADLHAWMRHLSPTGVMCGHDYCEEFPGVVDAVNAFCAEAGITPHLAGDTSIWYFTKAQYLQGLLAKEEAEAVT